MLTLVHCPFSASTVSKTCFATLLKVGFILSDEVASIGFTNYYVEFLMRLESSPNELKLKIMLSNLDPVINADLIEYVHEFQKAGKEFNKKKHKQTIEIKWYKAYENAVMVHYKNWARQKTNELDTEGFVTLQPLICDTGNIGVYYLKEDNYSIGGDKSEYTMNMESMLNLLLPDSENKNTLLSFHELFMNSTIMKDVLFVPASSPLADDINNSYFYYAASITNINVLTLAELKALKYSFNNKLVQFRNLVDEWTIRCNVGERKTAGIEYFKEHIIPALPLLNKCFEEENILKYNFQHEILSNYFLYIGEITKTALLNYYTTLDVITNEDRVVLEEKMRKKGTFERRIPMIIISKDSDIKLPRLSDTGIPLPEELETIKKFIEVD